MIDMRLDEGDDIAIVAGDFEMNECTMQHQRLLILTEKGEWKGSPTVGVGAQSYLENDFVQELPRAVSQEFARDGMRVHSVQILTNGTLNTNADYL